MPASSFRHAVAFSALFALLVGVTRIHHFSSIPDASWAMFFAGGFYLHTRWRWAFLLLMGVAVLADAYAIQRAGMDFWGHYCVSPAYWFLLPSYLTLWLGGAWLARRGVALDWRSLGLLSVVLLTSTGLCYLLSNGSFYWLSDSWGGAQAQRSMAGWFANLGHWFLPFLSTTAIYVALVAMLHAVALAAGLGVDRSVVAGRGGR
ncbi:hypothetical protein OS187_01030 [Xanthomonadaceae bacterium JHOS43]|nr:hypothetical protein [Xanthomonadaceae bacterium JHOS43]